MSKNRRRNRTQKKWNRDVPDDILLIHSTRSALDRPESLCPSAATMDRFCAAVPEAQAIILSYQLLAPIVKVRS